MLAEYAAGAAAELSLLYGATPAENEVRHPCTVPSAEATAAEAEGRALSRELRDSSHRLNARAAADEAAFALRSAALRQRWMETVEPLGSSVFGRYIEVQTRQSATLCSSPAVRRTMTPIRGGDVLSKRLGFGGNLAGHTPAHL